MSYTPAPTCEMEGGRISASIECVCTCLTEALEMRMTSLIAL